MQTAIDARLLPSLSGLKSGDYIITTDGLLYGPITKQQHTDTKQTVLKSTDAS